MSPPDLSQEVPRSRRAIRRRSVAQVGALATLLGAAGCGVGAVRAPGSEAPDLRAVGGDAGAHDLAIPADLTGLTGDLADPGGQDLVLFDPCGDSPPDPACRYQRFGPPTPPFPLLSDPQKSNLERDLRLERNGGGELVLDFAAHASFNTLWLANELDYHRDGSVSRLDVHGVREVARYQSYTCRSLPTGSPAACDGHQGCCSVDDWPRFQARSNLQPDPGHQPVQKNASSPARTVVDFNGDLFVANAAYGGQSSVTRIAGELSRCIDRDRSGGIDTSSDANGDGVINEDCNSDGIPDDRASVKARPCTNGLPQEYFGGDDECILWTANVFVPKAVAHALALSDGGPGLVPTIWVGSQTYGTFVGLDAQTGQAWESAQLPAECTAQLGPFGMAIDRLGIAWVAPQGAGKLCYFNTLATYMAGSARDPEWGPASGHGITIDRDQNIWLGDEIARYAPDRRNGFASLGSGHWTRIGNLQGQGIAADWRGPHTHSVYACLDGGATVLQIPAAGLALANVDQTVVPGNWSQIAMPCLGVGVDSDQNVWGVSNRLSTRALVDNNGGITQPRVNQPPMGQNRCPAGDSCENPGATAYSDFTGFERAYGPATGLYQMVVPGCRDDQGRPRSTQWIWLTWNADVPPGTNLVVRAMSGDASDVNDVSWRSAQVAWEAGPSALNLLSGLVNNWTYKNRDRGAPDGNLLVQFTFIASAQVSPVLRQFDVSYKCSPPK